MTGIALERQPVGRLHRGSPVSAGSRTLMLWYCGSSSLSEHWATSWCWWCWCGVEVIVWVTAYDILTPSWQFGLKPCKLLFLWQSLTMPTWRRSSYIDWLNYASSYIRWAVFVVGTLGNILVLVVLLWRRSNSQVGTQLFVGSLAVADLGLIFSSAWVKAYDLLQTSWQFGTIPCKLHFLWQLLTMYCSIWTLAALSVDRYVLKCLYTHSVNSVCG